MRRSALFAGLCLAFGSFCEAAEPLGLTVSWDKNFLTIRGDKLPGREMKVNYIEAYCRAGSTDQEWGKTVVGHTTELLSAGEDGKSVKLRCTLKDGVTVLHEIRAGDDEIDFRLTAHNSTDKASEAIWAQPCIRVDAFTGEHPRVFQAGRLGGACTFAEVRRHGSGTSVHGRAQRAQRRRCRPRCSGSLTSRSSIRRRAPLVHTAPRPDVEPAALGAGPVAH